MSAGMLAISDGIKPNERQGVLTATGRHEQKWAAVGRVF